MASATRWIFQGHPLTRPTVYEMLDAKRAARAKRSHRCPVHAVSDGGAYAPIPRIDFAIRNFLIELLII
ncbi:MAG: hypothetical protein WA109_03690 [Bellilinea sp.]